MDGDEHWGMTQRLFLNPVLVEDTTSRRQLGIGTMGLELEMWTVRFFVLW